MTWCLLILAFSLLCGAQSSIKEKLQVYISGLERMVPQTFWSRSLKGSDTMIYVCTKDKQKPGTSCTDVNLAILKTYIFHTLTVIWQTGTWGYVLARGPPRAQWIANVGEEQPSWKCDCHTSSLPFQKHISIRVFHNTPPTPNNNITITSNHTVLSQPPWGEAWKWTESEFIFISLCADGQKATFFGFHLSSFEEKKNAAIH